eukprot:2687105-Pleurochrysis_carterae.AAC.10
MVRFLYYKECAQLFTLKAQFCYVNTSYQTKENAVVRKATPRYANRNSQQHVLHYFIYILPTLDMHDQHSLAHWQVIVPCAGDQYAQPAA